MKRQDETQAGTIKVLALLEPDVVTGAAKSLFDFCQAAREHAARAPSEPHIETSVATYVRPQGKGRNASDNLSSANDNLSSSSDKPSSHSSGSSEKDLHKERAPNQFVAAALASGLTVDIIPERFRFDRHVLDELRGVVALRQPHVIVSYHVKSHSVVKASGLWRQYPWIAFHHGYTTTDLKMRAYNQLDRWSLPTAHRVLTVCDAFARELIERKGVRQERVRVQHNSIRPAPAVDPEMRVALRQRFNIAADEKVILVIGRFSREKAHVDLIEALGWLRREQPTLKTRLLIVGDGPERVRMNQRATELGISESIVYAGQVNDVQPYYAAADVMALPSHSEGSPFVLLEAMAAGVPVVATAVGGVPEMVADGESALLVPAKQPQALAAALWRVLEEENLAQQLARNASALVATRYAPETYFRSLAEIYFEAARLVP
jgi:glycosyltransferase involved in cell wall biosynthesis